MLPLSPPFRPFPLRVGLDCEVRNSFLYHCRYRANFKLQYEVKLNFEHFRLNQFSQKMIVFEMLAYESDLLMLAYES